MVNEKVSDFEQCIGKLVPTVKRMVGIYQSYKATNEPDMEVLRENIQIGQLTAKGIYSVYQKIKNGEADEGDLYIAGFMMNSAAEYIRVAEKFIANFDSLSVN